jgi:DNA topoisomerase I
VPRLRRSDPGAPGLTRRRRGRGWELRDPAGELVSDPETIARVRALAIPPAWKDVWICPDPRGHVQATGTDAAGRRQYRYHEDWSLQRARRKFDDMLAFARILPVLRERLEEDLGRPDLDAQRVLACTVRLLDRGFFRIGCEDYAEKNQTYGLATMRKDHVRVLGDGAILFDFPAKHGLRHVKHVVDPVCAEIVGTLRRRRGGGAELLAYREGRAWRDIRSDHINAYLKDRTGLDVSAKDFRTWNATVLAAKAVAVAGPAWRTKTGRKRAEVRAVTEVAHYLGNTPAVARSSYIDPRVFDRFAAGLTIAGALAEDDPDPREPVGVHAPAVEAAVIDLIDEREGEAPFGADLAAAA